jgi:hypothetical protein
MINLLWETLPYAIGLIVAVGILAMLMSLASGRKR